MLTESELSRKSGPSPAGKYGSGSVLPHDPMRVAWGFGQKVPQGYLTVTVGTLREAPAWR